LLATCWTNSGCVTNRRRQQFVKLLIIKQQVAIILLADEDEPEAPVELQPQEGHTGGVRRRRYTRRRTAAQLARGRKLPGLGAALGVQNNTELYCSNSLYYGDSSRPMRGRLSHTVRAAASFHGAQWLDWLRYRGPRGDQRVGQAALVVHSRAGTWERLVVRRAESAASRHGCVLTDYGCQRLQWVVSDDQDASSVDMLEAKDVECWIPVEHDWEDLSERHGVTVLPDDVPNTVEELRAARFFVNAFVREYPGEEENGEDE